MLFRSLKSSGSTNRPEESDLLRALAIMFLLLAAGSGGAAEQNLESLKQTYETEVQKIQDGHEARLSKLLDTYSRSLDKAVEILKKKGDPDLILAAVAEKRRFADEQTVPEKPDIKLPDVIQQVQSGYVEAKARADVEKGTKFVQLTRKYMAALDKLMRLLAVHEKLDLSLNVKQEKERAGFVLAHVETKLASSNRGAQRSVTVPKGLNEDLVLHYGFDSYRGDEVLDKSGERNHGKLKGKCSETTGKIGSACRLGRSAYIRVPDDDSLDLPSEFTVALWVQFDSASNNSWVVSKTDFERDKRSYHLGYFGNQKHPWAMAATQKPLFKRTHAVNYLWRAPIQDGVWHHVAIVHSAKSAKTQKLRMFLDGRVVLSVVVTADNAGAPAKNDLPLLIGVLKEGGGTKALYLDGAVDEVTIWRRALSAAEVKQVYEVTGGK